MDKYYRITYKDIGIYEALRQAVSMEVWRGLLKSSAFTWLPKPPEYTNYYNSYFTQAGYEKFCELVKPLIDKYIKDPSNIKVEITPASEINKESIVYEDQFQIVVSNDKYDPPLEYNKLPEHLKGDEIHSWRAKNGIELIHKEPSVEEFERIWKNWNLMDDDMKKTSDQKSLEFFGMNNEDHYNKLKLYYSLPQKWYHGRRSKYEVLIPERDIFLTPYPGIASLFITPKTEMIIDLFRKKYRRDPERASFNCTYDEWHYPDEKLKEPLKEMHINHNVKDLADVKSEGYVNGFIYEIDKDQIIDNFDTFVTNDPNREIIYKGKEPLIPERVIPVTVKYYINYKENPEHPEGIVEYQTIIEENFNYIENWLMEKMNINLNIEDDLIMSIEEATNDVFYFIEKSSLSKHNIRDILVKLGNKYSMRFIYIHDGSNLGKNIGGAAVFKVNKDIIKKLENGSYISSHDLNSNQRYETIVVNPKRLRHDNLTPELLTTIIEHELGHLLTINRISDIDFEKSNIKKGILASIVGAIQNYFPNLIENKNQFMGELDYLYRQIDVEKIADKAAGIDSKNFCESLYNIKIKGLKWFDSEKFNSWKVPDKYIQIVNSDEDFETMDERDYRYYFDTQKYIYRTFITFKPLRDYFNKLIKNIENEYTQKRMFKAKLEYNFGRVSYHKIPYVITENKKIRKKNYCSYIGIKKTLENIQALDKEEFILLSLPPIVLGTPILDKNKKYNYEALKELEYKE